MPRSAVVGVVLGLVVAAAAAEARPEQAQTRQLVGTLRRKRKVVGASGLVVDER